MVKNRVVFREGSFIDYANRERKFIVAAVSQYVSEVLVCTDDPAKINCDDICKKLSLGFAICSPEDKWNEDLGKTIALGKAIKRPARVMWVSNPGMINTRVVDALLEQEIEYFKINPGSIIAGYDEAKNKYKQSTEQY